MRCGVSGEPTAFVPHPDNAGKVSKWVWPKNVMKKLLGIPLLTKPRMSLKFSLEPCLTGLGVLIDKGPRPTPTLQLNCPALSLETVTRSPARTPCRFDFRHLSEGHQRSLAATRTTTGHTKP